MRLYNTVRRIYSAVTLASSFVAMVMMFDITGWMKVLAITITIISTTFSLLVVWLIEKVYKNNFDGFREKIELIDKTF